MPRDRQRRRWREGGWPRGTRPSVMRSGLRAGRTRPARSSGYVKQQVEIGNSGSLRSSTTSTTSSDCGQRSLRLRRTPQQAWMERRGSTTVRTLRRTSRISHRLKRGVYRARPVRRVYIPKVGKPGELWPLSVPALEDKIVQRATVEVLNAIYEQDFLGFSYGFRPGRSPHQAG